MAVKYSGSSSFMVNSNGSANVFNTPSSYAKLELNITSDRRSNYSGKRKSWYFLKENLLVETNIDCDEVSRIEAGKRLKPNVLYLKGIADTLNLSMVDLMELAGYNGVDIRYVCNVNKDDCPIV